MKMCSAMTANKLLPEMMWRIFAAKRDKVSKEKRIL
jgi:hypothetical protein